MKLLHPIVDIGQKKTLDRDPSVVEQFGVPLRVDARLPVDEIQFARAVELRQPLGAVFHRMGVYQVHHHRDTHPVRRIDQPAQVVRHTETRGWREEIGHMIAERTVVRVFLYGHQLQYVVSQSGDAGQNVPGKFLPGTHMAVLGSHSRMGFVDQGREVRRQAEFRVLPSVVALREELSGEIERGFVLYHAAYVGRDTVQSSVVRNDAQFDPREGRQPPSVGRIVQECLP